MKSELVEGKEYGICHPETTNSQVGRPGVDYLLTADDVKILGTPDRPTFGDAELTVASGTSH